MNACPQGHPSGGGRVRVVNPGYMSRGLALFAACATLLPVPVIAVWGVITAALSIREPSKGFPVAVTVGVPIFVLSQLSFALAIYILRRTFDGDSVSRSSLTAVRRMITSVLFLAVAALIGISFHAVLQDFRAGGGGFLDPPGGMFLTNGLLILVSVICITVLRRLYSILRVGQ